MPQGSADFRPALQVMLERGLALRIASEAPPVLPRNVH